MGIYHKRSTMETEKTVASHVAARVRDGASKQAITEELHAVGWSDDEIDAAYAEALVASGVPVPTSETRGGLSRRASTLDIVVNFFSFILLGIVSTALGTLYFKVIDKFFPDPLAYSSYWYNYNNDAVHYAIAALIIGYPAYYFVVRFWFKRFREDTGKVESKLTKWLTYLVLLIASVTIIGDLIAILFTFLQGEISARFFLKALTVLVISGAVFGFYFLERRKVQYKQDIPRRTFKLFGYALTILVLLGIVLGFIAAGSPGVARDRAFDERRAQDLNNIVRCISTYSREFYRLPATLDELQGTTLTSRCATYRDPKTGAPYEYRIITEPVFTSEADLQATARYELCATFAFERSVDDRRTYYPAGEKWSVHDAGRDCDEEELSVMRSLPLPVRANP